MSPPFRDAELRYMDVRTQALALVRVVKKFRHYSLRSKIIVVVPDVTIKMLLVQSEHGEKRAKWITVLQEYDMDITPMKLVRG